MNKYAQHYFNAYVNKMAETSMPYVEDHTGAAKAEEVRLQEIEDDKTKAFALQNRDGSEDAAPEAPVVSSSFDITTGVNPNTPTMDFTQGSSSMAPSLQDRWSKYHGKGPKNAYNPNSKRDVAMLKAMEAAQGGGERAIRAIANGPLSRPAIRPARR